MSMQINLQQVLHSVHIWRNYGRISMKFNGSIAAGTWTNWLGFELDRDHSPDPGTGFTPDFWISAGYLKKLWTDFDEIFASIAAGVQRRRYMFLPVFFTSDKGGSGTCLCPCSFVCLSVSKISQKRFHGFGYNVACRQMSGHGRTD